MNEALRKKNEKVETFTSHILAECEKEGFSVGDLFRILRKLEWAIKIRHGEIMSATPFTVGQDFEGKPRNTASNH